MEPAILYVDDDEPNLDLFRRCLDEDFRVLTARSGPEALEVLAREEVGVLVSDQRMEPMTGIELLAISQARYPLVTRMLLTAYSDRELLLAAIQKGRVDDYLLKPWQVEDLALRLRNGLEVFNRRVALSRAAEERDALKQELTEGRDPLVGLDRGLAAVGQLIARIAPTDATVMIRGESGTGKELIAREIHERSARKKAPFIRTNCAAFSEGVLESELFGHEAGSFTGAKQSRLGRFEQANGGTLFLDEIGDVSPAIQVKLLRVLQEREFERVGGNAPVKVDIRIIAATHRNLEELVKQGTFRGDLFYRLNVVPLQLPPLRERPADIDALANHFAKRFSVEMGKQLTLSPSASAALRAYDWPGNVRELRNVLERAAVLADVEMTLEASDLIFDMGTRPTTPATGTPRAPAGSVFESIAAEERGRIEAALRQTAGSVTRSAKLLGMPRTTLSDRMKKLGDHLMFRVPTFLEAPARFPFDDVEDRMNTRRGVPFQRVLAEHATRSAQRTLTVRPMAVLGWLAVCTVFGVFGDRPDLRANFVPVMVYLGLSLALLAAARLSPAIRKYSVLGLVLLDLPTIFLIQYQGVPLSPSPAGTAGFSVGILAVVLMVSVLTMRARNVIVIGVVSAVLQAILMARGGIDPGGIAAGFVVFGALATFGAYTTEQVWALMEGVSNEEIKVAEAAQERLAMASQIKEAEALGRLNADLRARSEDLSRTLEALRSAQADLIRAERMASVATLVKGIAHELNNPIGYIAGNMGPLRRYCDFLVRVATDLADGRPRSPAELAQLTQLSPRKDLKFVAEDLVRLTSDVDEGARRAKLIIGDLQSLTTSQRGVEQVDLARAVNQTLALLKPRTGPGVRIDTQLDPVAPVTARAGQLEQVLVNLVDNALRAVGPHGHVLVKLEAAETRFRLIVKDDGPGMTAEVKKQALEPFFTTRAPGEGSGMGLAIVAAIVSGHQGTVTLNSEPGAGTEIVIDLPLRPELPSREVAAVKRAGARDEDRF